MKHYSNIWFSSLLFYLFLNLTTVSPRWKQFLLLVLWFVCLFVCCNSWWVDLRLCYQDPYFAPKQQLRSRRFMKSICFESYLKFSWLESIYEHANWNPQPIASIFQPILFLNIRVWPLEPDLWDCYVHVRREFSRTSLCCWLLLRAFWYPEVLVYP